MKYSHIFFDWHGVLSHSYFWYHLPEFDLIEKGLFGSLHPLLKKWLEGSCDANEFVTALALKTNLSFVYLMDTLKESCGQFKFSSDQIPELIKDLRDRGIKCVIATDNFDVFDMWVVPALGLDTLFDEILNSYNLKHVKPEIINNSYRPFFSPYLESQKVSKALWIDDHDCSRQAKLLGMDFRLFKPSENLPKVLSKLI